jgi:hypothetical protein
MYGISRNPTRNVQGRSAFSVGNSVLLGKLRQNHISDYVARQNLHALPKKNVVIVED